MNATDKTVLYEKDADTRLMPASNQKLISCLYALSNLGPEFKPKTRFWKNGSTILVDAPGDPMLTYSQLTQAKRALGKASVIKVKQAYRPYLPPSWEWDDLPNKYAAPVTSFTVDRGSFELWADNGRAFLLPANYGVKVVPMGGQSSRIDYDPAKGVVRVYGKIPTDRTRMDTLAIPRPDLAAASVLGGDFSTFAGDFPNRPPDYVIESQTLGQIASECLSKSDNNIAEHLLLLGAAKEGALGSDPYKTAGERGKAFLVSKVGINPNSVRIDDGSGLSRHNLVSARALVQVYGYGLATFGEPWKRWMAQPGTGTLGGRLENSSFQGKTGTLDMVCSLTGSVTDNSKNTLIISLVFNNYLQATKDIRALQDQIVRIIEKPDGTLIDVGRYCEKDFSFSSNRTPHGNWVLGLDHDCGAPRSRKNR